MELTAIAPPATTSKGSESGIATSYIKEIRAGGLLPRPNPVLNPMIAFAAKSHQQVAADVPRGSAPAIQRKSAALACGEQVRWPYNPGPFGEVSCIGLGMCGQLAALLA